VNGFRNEAQQEPRQLALDILVKVERQKAYADLLLDHARRTADL
jgi:hypothetical protein